MPAGDSEGRIIRLILLSDGVANVGSTRPDSILREVCRYADDEITLPTVGFGIANFNDVLMEQLANDGDGNYAYVDTLSQARRVFVENLTGMLQVIAKDAKVQVDFDPSVVSRYRLLGYENRRIADRDFRNDTVDAAEVGAGHTVTALYEIKLSDDVQGRIATVYIRYQDPESGCPRDLSRIPPERVNNSVRGSIAPPSTRCRSGRVRGDPSRELLGPGQQHGASDRGGATGQQLVVWRPRCGRIHRPR